MKPLCPERRCLLHWGQAPLLQHFCTAQLSPSLGCRVGMALEGQAWGWCHTAHRQALLCLSASEHWRQSPPASPVMLPWVFLHSTLFLILHNPNSCRGIILSAWGRGKTHIIRERKTGDEGCCPPSSLSKSAEADRA